MDYMINVTDKVKTVLIVQKTVSDVENIKKYAAGITKAGKNHFVGNGRNSITERLKQS